MVGYRSPNQNAYVEWFVQAIERECVDKFIVFGREHLDHVCREYVEHYHVERPHQAKGNRPLTDIWATTAATGMRSLSRVAQVRGESICFEGSGPNVNSEIGSPAHEGPVARRRRRATLDYCID